MLSVRGVSGGRALRAEVPAGTWLAKGVCRPVRRPAADGASPSALVGSEERRSGVTVQPVSTPAALRV